MRKVILEFNVPTVNGRIYTRDQVRECPSKGFIYTDTYAQDLEKVVGHFENLVIDDDCISCDIVLYPRGEIFGLLDESIRYFTCGVGFLEGGYVRDFVMSHVSFELIKAEPEII